MEGLAPVIDTFQAMTDLQLQCNLSTESRSSSRLVPPHIDMPYVTAALEIHTRLRC